MIPQEFEYSSPASLQEALTLVAGGNAKILAGGMSLIPLMKLRLAAPERLVDLGRIPGLNTIQEDGGSIRIGAMTTHFEMESSPLIRAKCPLLTEAAASIGDVQVRNMGTIGGSIAHADPSADYPASLMALEAKVRVVSAQGERVLAIGDFLVDALMTALEPGEIVREIIVPVEAAGTGVSYKKMLQPASGFAIVGVAARLRKSGGKISFARVGITGLASKAFRAANVEKLLEGTSGSAADIRQAAAVAAAEVDANADLHASGNYRKQMASVYAARALSEALLRAS
jgi:carbon-monoxide dehydrogenase medium subunit